MGTAKPREGQCTYAYRDGKRCTSEIEGRGQFCFWHDPAANKESPDIKDRLQEWARSHRYLEGIKLRYAQLEGIKLGGSKGVDLSNADLFHANLKKARLTNVNLKDANLVKTDLSRARLSQVNIQDANLMGVQLRGAKMDRVDWGKAVLNEKLGAAAERKGKEHQASQFYREALLVYQHLGRVYARNRDGKMASRLFMREMEMQRKLMPRGSVVWLWSMLVDLVCGYGEKPLRVFGLALVIVLISGGFYSYYGVRGSSGPGGIDVLLGFSSEVGLVENAVDFLHCAIFSAKVFFSLGYSDQVYEGAARTIASIEAFLGGLVMAFFLVLAVRKHFR